MKLEQKIVTIFLGNHLSEFKKWCDSKSEPFFFREPFIASRAFKMARTLDMDPRDIVDLKALNQFYDEGGVDKPFFEDITIEQAFKKCNNELLEAINASKISSQGKKYLTKTACTITDTDVIDTLIALIKLRGDRYLGESDLTTLLSDYKNYGRAVGENESDRVLARFILENETMLNQWLNKLEAVNSQEKFKLIMDWCYQVEDEQRILEELFCSGSNEIEGVSKVA